MERFLQVYYVLFSAFISATAIQNEILPFGSPFLGLFALVPLYLAVSRSKNYLEAALLTGAHTGLTHLLSSFWLAFFKDFAVFTLGASAFGTAVIGFVFGCYLYLPFDRRQSRKFQCTFLYTQQTAPVSTRILYFSAVWVLYEWCKSNGFLAYPWGTIHMSSWKWPVITQIADITGVTGITFLFAFCSALTAEAILLLPFCRTQLSYTMPLKKRVRELGQCAAVWILLIGFTAIYGVYHLTQEHTPIKYLTATVVQHNVDSWNETGDDGSTAILTSQDITSQQLALHPDTDLIVWSESVIPYAMPQAKTFYQQFPFENPLIPFIANNRIPLIVGGPVTLNQEKHFYGNSAILFGRSGSYNGFYSKMQLVPFAEIIPYGDTEWMQRFMQKVVGFSSGWTQGTSLTLFDIPLDDTHKRRDAAAYPQTMKLPPLSQNTARVSIPICFEDAFPSVCRALFIRGSEAFLNITNDSWSRMASAEYQHFAVAAFRSIEFRCTMLRATNSGYSVLIDPTGQITADMPLFQSCGQTWNIPIYKRTMTTYALLGDWFPFICCLFSIIYAVYIKIYHQQRNNIICTLDTLFYYC